MSIINIDKELSKFSKKNILEVSEIDTNSIYNSIEKMLDEMVDLKTLSKKSEKINKKNFINLDNVKNKVEELIDNEIMEKNNSIRELKRNLQHKGKYIDELIQNILLLKDFITEIYEFSKNNELNGLIDTLSNINKIIEKELNKIGLVEIKTKELKFDPHYHNCIEKVKNSTKEKEVIIQVIKKGYLLNGELYRPAEVRIAE